MKNLHSCGSCRSANARILFAPLRNAFCNSAGVSSHARCISSREMRSSSAFAGKPSNFARVATQTPHHRRDEHRPQSCARARQRPHRSTPPRALPVAAAAAPPSRPAPHYLYQLHATDLPLTAPPCSADIPRCPSPSPPSACGITSRTLPSSRIVFTATQSELLSVRNRRRIQRRQNRQHLIEILPFHVQHQAHLPLRRNRAIQHQRQVLRSSSLFHSSCIALRDSQSDASRFPSWCR